MTPAAFLREKARSLGFQAVGFTSAADFDATEEVILQRVEAGLMSGLDWFTPARVRLACRPRDLLPGARSIVALAASYNSEEPQAPMPGGHTGRIARYAWGQDYHEVLKARCRALVEALAAELGYHPGARTFIDSSPLVDRAVAHRSGTGWYGKNTNVLVHGLGSWAFLAAVILDIDLPEGEPLLTHCGSCDLCIRACPTGALLSPYVLDNTRCISYQTIENRGTVPTDLRGLMGNWIFGCDICQDVCPVNRRAERAVIPEFAGAGAEAATPILEQLLLSDASDYQRQFRGRAVKRAKQKGLQRNAAVALGNTGERDVVPVLEKAMQNENAVVRSHVAWAMGRLGGRRARATLEASLRRETDPEAREAIRRAQEESS